MKPFLRTAEFGFGLLLAAFLLSAEAAAGQSPQGTYLTTTDVHVRKGPGTNYEVVTTIPKGVKVNVVGREGAWLKVESKHGNKPGYINEQYARPVQDQQTAQTKTVVAEVAGPYGTIKKLTCGKDPDSNIGSRRSYQRTSRLTFSAPRAIGYE